jgi:hypothetical protein
MKWDRYYAPKALYTILDSGIYPRLSKSPFTAIVDGEEIKFDRGTIVIPVNQRDADSEISSEEIYNMVNNLAETDHVKIYATNSATTPSGPDLGGAFHSVLNKPKVALLSGDGTSSYGVGEIWHLLNFRMGLPISLLNAKKLNARKLSKYNTIIVPDGWYSNLDSMDIKNLKSWISNGGTLIATQSGSKWVVNKKVLDEKLKKAKKDTLDIPYDQVQNVTGAQRIGGAIFEIALDNTHPIAYGYGKSTPVFRRGDSFFALSAKTAANVGRYTDNPLLSGYISEENLDEIKGSASIIARKQGGGHVILFADNPNFRAFWYGTNGLFLNAVFFGQAF